MRTSSQEVSGSIDGDTVKASAAPSSVAQADHLRRMLDDFRLEFDQFLNCLTTGLDDASPRWNCGDESIRQEGESGGGRSRCTGRESTLLPNTSVKTRVQDVAAGRNEDNYEKIRKLKLAFETVLKRTPSHARNRRSDVITAEDIFVLRQRYRSPSTDYSREKSQGALSSDNRLELSHSLVGYTKEECIDKYKSAINVLKDSTFGSDLFRTRSSQSFFSLSDDSPDSGAEINVESYVKLMLIDSDYLRAYDCGDKAVTLALIDIHDLFFVIEASTHVKNILHLTSRSSLGLDFLGGVERRNLTLLVYECINCVSGILVMINALTLGLSLDYYSGWLGWSIFDWAFTVSFNVELILRVALIGPRNFFARVDIGWNVFDTLVVVVATADMISTIAFTRDLISNVSTLRVLRFLRLTKYVRLIRLRMFKELRLLVSGMLVGYKTLFWALVLLSYLVYFIGIMARDSFGKTDSHSCDVTPWGSISCEESLALFLRNKEELVGSLGRSMYTTFRCFMAAGECTSLDGTPLGLLFWEIYGWPYALFYVLLLIFVIFGVFNLIMAVFVESTIERAKQHKHLRLEEQQVAHAQKAKLLEELVIRCCKRAPIAKPKSVSRFYRLTALFNFNASNHLDSELALEEYHSEDMKSELSYDEFMRLLDDPEIKKTLDELDISRTFRSELFDILDANRDGVLEVKELVDGVLKLRGCDSPDVAALTLLCRSLQTSIKTLEAMLMLQTKADLGISRASKPLLI